MFVKWKAMSSANIWVNCLLVALGVCAAVLPPSARGLSTVDERESRKLFGGYRITPKFCKPSKTLAKSDPRSKGPTICMFNHECAQRSGEVVGACMDGFLFGACCQILGEIDHSLIQQAQASYLASNHAAAQSYETYGNQQSTSNIHKNTQTYSASVNGGYGNAPSENEYTAPTGGEFYETGTDLESEANQGGHYASGSNNLADKNSQFYVDSDSVVVSSPSSNQYGEYASSTASSVVHQSANSQASFSTELPMQMQNGHYSSQYDDDFSQTTPSSTVNSAGGGGHFSTLITNTGSAEFSHSDITHPGADADLVEEDLQFSTGYGPSTAVVPSPQESSATSISSSTESQKVVYQKPVFKPKPTPQSAPSQNNNHNYVLVQTISNSKPPSKKPFEGITTSDIESIESIILMLNETKHGPAYNVENSSQGQVTYGGSGATHRPSLSTNAMNNDKHNTNGFYVTTLEPPASSATHRPSTTLSSQSAVHNSITLSSTYQPSTYSVSSTTPLPSNNNQHYFSTTTNRPSVVYIKQGTTTKVVPSNAKPRPPQENEIIITPTRRPPTRRPTKTPPPKPTNLVTAPTRVTVPTPAGRPSTNFGNLNTKKPPSTSYVTGPTTPRPRPSTTSSYLSSTSFNSGSEGYKPTQNAIYSSSYGSNVEYTSSTQKISAQHQTESHIHPNLPATHPPPSPTVIITPKPTANLVTSSSWTQRPGVATSPKLPSTSFIYNPVVTDRPDLDSNSAQFIKVPTVVSNDFDDPGYYGNTATNRPDMNQGTTASFFSVRPTDDRPAFPGYYGPTPTYSTFHLPISSDLTDDNEEETNTSPNDFVNFPPVRNPNLNMSATSSAVTYDIELSTPAFVEDEVLKDKMNILVDKIVQSLQGNFDALAEIVEERNVTFPFGDTTTKKPGSPVKRPQSTKPSSSSKPTPSPSRTTTVKPSGTRKPVTPSKKPVSTKKTTVKPSSLDTRKPLGTSTKRPTKPTRRVPTTVATIENDAGEEDIGEETESADNEITTEATRRIECGVRPHVKSGRIVGGKGAVFGEWPWQVLVRESTWLGLFTKNKCGGVLITNKYVITAAHCQPGFLASLVAVFGEFDISGDLESKRSVTKNVKRVIVHRQYDAATFENDLALLELETAIHYDTHIVPICMPADTADFTGRMATVTGWGRLKYGGGVPSVLQEVQVPIIENSVCQEMFHTAGHQKKILPSFLCAGYANGQKDSCEGDSGGPLVLQREDGRWQLAGTVSHGIKCAAPYLPGVYMRTTYYKPWLKSITGVK